LIPQFPRVKINLSPIRLDKERIRFGGFQPKISRNITTKKYNAVLWDLCLYMDGNKDVNTICSFISEKYDIANEVICKIINDMISCGVIEDGKPDTLGFTAEEVKRYDRNINLFSWIDLSDETNHWKYQARLRDSSVAIIGTGGVGSHIAVNLARMGVGNIKIIDGDLVDESNLNRQPLFNNDSIGKSKAEAAKQELNKINPFIHIEAINKFVCTFEDVVSLVQDVDLFFLSADEPRGVLNRIVNRAAYSIEKPFIVAGYASTAVNFSTYIPGKTPCFECILKWQVIDVKGWEETYHAEKRFGIRHAVVAPIASLCGSLGSLEAMYNLLGLPPRSSDIVTQIDVFSNGMTKFEKKYYPDCPVCNNPNLPLDCE
jgi:molybdopterin/thiamine biosynthesis adenylyltransferase